MHFGGSHAVRANEWRSAALGNDRADKRRTCFIDCCVGRCRSCLRTANAQARSIRADNHAVDQAVVGTAAQKDCRQVTDVAPLQERKVGKTRILTRSVAIVGVVRVGFDHRVTSALTLYDDGILDVCLGANIGVEAVIICANCDEILHVDATAEKFDCVIRTVERLDMVNYSARANTASGERLEFRVTRKHEARITDLHVA